MAKNNIIQIAQLQARYSGTYEFTVTDVLDEQFYKYLARKLRDVISFAPEHRHTDVFPIDISLDDVEGDVVAGLAGFIHQDILTMDLLWVGDKLRGKGIGKRMVQMAEDIALQRGAQKSPHPLCQREHPVLHWAWLYHHRHDATIARTWCANRYTRDLLADQDLLVQVYTTSVFDDRV